MLPNGHILDARYIIERPLGTGGMASVYLSWDEMLRRSVAVKVLHPSYAADSLFIERFKREAEATAKLSHANIVTIYDWGTDAGIYYIVMEYMPGQNLKMLLQEHGPLPEAEVVAIARQIAAALDVAHEQGIVHRDITPQNILITPEGIVKVADFGIAYAAGTTHLTIAQTVMGTVQYISPEQVLREPVDGRTDLYSLGIVLYELLTGCVPFIGDSVAAVALQHAYDHAPSPRTQRPDISAEMETIICKALEKDPAKRYQTAAELQVALAAAHVQIEERRTATAPLPLTTSPLAVTIPQRAPPSVSARHLSPHARWLLALPFAALLMLLFGGKISLGSSGIPLSGLEAAGAPTTTTVPTIAPTVAPTMAPVFALPTAAATSPASPTPTVAPATPVSPTPTPHIVVQASSPAAAVLGFYQFVTQHQFDAAAALWTPNLQAQQPPAQSINARYAQTTRITVQHWEVTEQTADRATVSIAVSVYIQGTETPQNQQGAWHLVHTDSGWLLDGQEMQPA